MTQINIKADCGNSPKMTFLKEFNIAFAQGNIEEILSRVSEEVSWNLVGHWTRQGKAEFSGELESTNGQKMKELIIEHVVSHGKKGAVNGILIREDGKKYAFADFYEFSNAKGSKIKSITTYMIALED